MIERGPLSDEPRENENQDVAAPSVGELEWKTRKDRRTIARIKSGPWSVVDYPSGGCWLRFCDASVKFCESESAAKSLANSLQRILSGAAE